MKCVTYQWSVKVRDLFDRAYANKFLGTPRFQLQLARSICGRISSVPVRFQDEAWGNVVRELMALSESSSDDDVADIAWMERTQDAIADWAKGVHVWVE